MQMLIKLNSTDAEQVWTEHITDVIILLLCLFMQCMRVYYT